jgi:hypothetical protein
METLPPESQPPQQSLPPDSVKKVAPPPASLPEYFAAAKISNPRVFLKSLCKGAVSIPSHDDLRAIVESPDIEKRVAPRVVGLLQNIDVASETIRNSLLDLAELLLRHLGHIRQDADPPSLSECRAIASRLLAPGGRKPKKLQPDLFGCFLLLAYHRNWLTPPDAVALLDSAFTVQRTKKSQVADNGRGPEDIVLHTPLKKTQIAPLLALNRSWNSRHEANEKLLRESQSQISELTEKVSELTATTVDLKSRIESLEADLREKDTRISELRQQLDDLQTAWLHRHDEMKSRIRGFLEGELTRWLQNASEAADADPPYLPVIQQRLRSSLNGIQSQLQWLSSD